MPNRRELIASSLPFLIGAEGMSAAENHGLRRVWFNRCCSHYGKVEHAFLDYLIEVKPQVAMCGNFGPNYWAARSYARDQGLAEMWTALGGGPVDRSWWKRFIERAHQNEIKVIGMFSLAGTFGDPNMPAGFFRFFDEQWDELALGARPLVRARELMQRRADETLWEERAYAIEGGAEYWGCPNNPHWRATLKAMVSAALPLGIDGFIALFPLRHDCLCAHCVAAFRKWLKAHFQAAQLRERWGIVDLESHRFTTINGWYESGQASAYALECLKFSQSALKDCFDEVFVQHGRRLKPNLILGQWNHIYRSSYQGPGQLAGTFAQLNADERCTLPSNRWCHHEDFVWYSIGNWTMYDKPEEQSLAEFVLERKYLYEAGDGRPVGIKTDDSVRIKSSIAEAVANGGFGYPRGPDYADAATRAAVKQVFAFLRGHEALFREARPYAEAALLWNRRAVHRGDTLHTAVFKGLGAHLVKNHALFDVLLEDNLNATRISRYRLLLIPQAADLSQAERTALAGFIEQGGRIVTGSQTVESSSIPLATQLTASDLQTIELRDYTKFRPLLEAWLPQRSTVLAPDSVAFTCFQLSRPRRLVVHLVNYLRDRSAAPGVRGATLERPIGQTGVAVSLRLPAGLTAARVRLLTPESEREADIAFQQRGPMAAFAVPRLLVYALAVVDCR